MRDSDCDAQPIARDKGKGPVAPNNVDTSMDEELSLGSFPSLNLLLAKNTQESTRTRSRKRPSPHSAFSDAISGASCRVRRETNRRQSRSGQAPGNPSVLPTGTLPPVLPAHPAFSATPTFHTPPAALIRRPDDMLSSTLGQHILDYEPPHGFIIPAFTTLDGSANPTNHMLHYNQAMTLNVCNDRLLCKVFLASLWGLTLACFTSSRAIQ